MKQISDEDLTLLYYGEHEDPGMAARVAASETLNARFDQLSAELALVDSLCPPERDEDFGSVVWMKIESRLDPRKRKSRLAAWREGLSQPRFSLAGILGLVGIAILAFMLGRTVPPPGADAGSGPQFVVSDLDGDRLLQSTISRHLDQLNVSLTGYVRERAARSSSAAWATDLLVANRVYRQAASAAGDDRLASFLTDLEPLLIELAYEAQNASNTTRQRIQQEIEEGLLFRIRVMNQQLKNTPIST